MRNKIIALVIISIGLIVNTSCSLLWQVDNTVDIEFTLSKEALLQAKTASALRTIGGDDSSESRRDEATISLHYETNDKLIAANQVFLVDDNDITISFNDLEIVGKGVYAQITATIDGIDYIGRSESKIMVTAINILEIDGMREATMQVETPEIVVGEYVSATSEWPITIACETPDAGILYSLSSNNHSTQYPYIKEFPVTVKDGDVTIRAYATKPGMKDSETTEKVLSKLVLEKLATPKIYHDGNELEQDAKIDFSKGLTFDNDTDGVVFSYKFSRSPDFTEISYPDPSVKNPVAIPSNATSIRVKANKTGYIESDEIEVWFEQAQVEAPSIVTVGEANAQGEKQIEISSTTDDVAIFYTINGDDPQTSVGGSTLEYSDPFWLPVMNENKTVKAIAVKVGYKDSLVTTQPISQAGAVEVPTVRYSGNILSEGSELDFSQGLTFENNTTGATISYKWNDGSFIEIGNGANTGAIPSGTTSVTFKAEMNGSVPSPDNTVHFTQAQVGAPVIQNYSSFVDDDEALDFSKGLNFSGTNATNFAYTFYEADGTTEISSGNGSSVSRIPDNSASVQVVASAIGYLSNERTVRFTQLQVTKPTISQQTITLNNGVELDFSLGLAFSATYGSEFEYTFLRSDDSEISSGSTTNRVEEIPNGAVKVQVYATLDGYKDSLLQTLSFTQMKVKKPTINYSSAPLVEGQELVFTNTLYFYSDTYSVEFNYAFMDINGVETGRGTGRSVVGIPNATRSVTVVAAKEGYADSIPTIISFTQEKVVEPIIKYNSEVLVNGQVIRYEIGLTFEGDYNTSFSYSLFTEDGSKINTNTTQNETGEIPSNATRIDVVAVKDGYADSNVVSVSFKQPQVEFYVSSTATDDSGDGSSGNPLLTVQEAVDRIIAGTENIDDTTEYMVYLSGTVDGGSDNSNGTVYINHPSELHITFRGLDASNTGLIDAGARFTVDASQKLDITIAGQGKRVMYVEGDNVYLTLGDYITIQGGTANGSSGAGVYFAGHTFTMKSDVSPSAGPTITGNVCTSNAVGGGVSIGNSNNIFIMSAGIISNNYGYNNGGVSIGAGSDFTMSGGSIHSNNAARTGGVGLYPETTFTMSGGTISDNVAGYCGGISADSAWNGYGSVFISGSAKIINNRATVRDGGGIYLKNYVDNESGLSTSAPLTISGSPTISGNKVGELGNDIDSNILFTNTQDTSPISLSEDITGTTPASIGLTPSIPDAGAMLIMNPLRHGINESYFFMDDTSLSAPVKVGDDLKMP